MRLSCFRHPNDVAPDYESGALPFELRLPFIDGYFWHLRIAGDSAIFGWVFSWAKFRDGSRQLLTHSKVATPDRRCVTGVPIRRSLHSISYRMKGRENTQRARRTKRRIQRIRFEPHSLQVSAASLVSGAEHFQHHPWNVANSISKLSSSFDGTFSIRLTRNGKTKEAVARR
jgi:hypothetical protein